LWSFVPVFIVYCIILSVYGAPVFDRQYLPAMPLLAVLGGIGLSALVAVCLKAYASQPVTGNRLAGARVAVRGVLALIMAVQTVNDDLVKLRPDQHNDIATWTSTTATTDPVLILNKDLELSVEPLYGYQGPTITKPYNDVMTVYVKDDQITAKV